MRTFAALLCCLVLTGVQPYAQRDHHPAPAPAGPATSPAGHAAPPPTQATAPLVSDTLAAQVMLDRLGFSSGEIDGRPGSNVKRAVAAFQQSKGRTPSGTLDDQTWQVLRESSASPPPLVMYTVSDADLAGPFSPDIPSDLVQQSMLDALHYKDALEALGEKFHASPQLLKALNPSLSLKAAGEQLLVPNVAPMEAPVPDSKDAAAERGSRPATPAAPQKVTIYVTKSTSALTVEDETGHVIFHAPVTTGSEHDPLPIGSWKVTGVQRNPVFNYNPALFWDANPAHSKAKIPSGPNNPVGVIWIDLSKPHYGLHGTPEPSNIGHVQSHGCVRLTNWDVTRVAQWARPGTPVIFRE